VNYPTIASVEEFVRWEEQQAERYEFSDGRISLFRGASVRHELIVVNVSTVLRVALGPGRVRGAQLKQLTATSSRYPDLSVSFDPRERPDATHSRYPTLLIEVLSKSTSATDRGPKADEYRSLETLREYVIIDSRKRWAQTIRRSGDVWVVSLPILNGTLDFESVKVQMPFDEIYAGTEL
jgi:Uma2 family endonuclease